MRLIDADALKDNISNIKLRVKNPEIMSGLVEMKEAALREIENAHTIEAEHVRYGWWCDWSMFNEPEYECSECNGISKKMYSFCPHCGARMDGDEDAAD